MSILAGNLKSFLKTTQVVMGSIDEIDAEEQETDLELEAGRTASSAFSHSVMMFQPDMMYENMVKDYKLAKNIYGERIIRQVTGQDLETVEKNIKLPEYKRELKKQINDNINKLKEEGILDNEYSLTEKAAKLAALALYVDELEKLYPRGLGEKELEKLSNIGETKYMRQYAKGDRFRDISISRTVKTAVRRQHAHLDVKDIRVAAKTEKGRIYVVYALDASGSMKGDKIDSCKKAGIALSYKAIDARDYVGLMVFGKDVKHRTAPTRDFQNLLQTIATIRAESQTDIAKTIRESIELYPRDDVTKHLVLITDAMPTYGDDPEKDTIEAAELARRNGITISIVGISLKKTELAEKIVKIGDGKLYVAGDTKDIDTLVLQDYYRIGKTNI